jgi:hypothetical protein
MRARWEETVANLGVLYPSVSSEPRHRGRLPDPDGNSPEDFLLCHHVLPVAWWFFFAPGDVRSVPVRSGESTWHELLLVSGLQEAATRFERRQELLLGCVGQWVTRGDLEMLLGWVKAWTAPYLVLDPDGILMAWSGTDEEHRQDFCALLEHVEKGDAEKALEVAVKYSGPLDGPERSLRERILG